jgi:hypothetical protein
MLANALFLISLLLLSPLVDNRRLSDGAGKKEHEEGTIGQG